MIIAIKKEGSEVVSDMGRIVRTVLWGKILLP